MKSEQLFLPKLEKEDIKNIVERKFSDSKVRDEAGNLLEVYHYSNEDFDEFSLDYIGKNYPGDNGFFGAGVYFTDSEDAFHYGKKKYSAYLNLKNPLIIKNPTNTDINNLHSKRDELIEQGYDGVMVWNDEIKDETKTIFGKEQLIKGRRAGWSELVAFNPEDIYILKKE